MLEESAPTSLGLFVPLSFSIQTGARSVLNTLDVQAARNLVVLSAGSAELAAIIAEKLQIVGPLVAVYLSPERLEPAPKLDSARKILVRRIIVV